VDPLPGLDYEFPQLLLYVRPTPSTLGTFRFKETGDFGLAVFSHQRYVGPYQMLLGLPEIILSEATFDQAIEIAKAQPYLDCLILLDDVLNPRFHFVKASSERRVFGGDP
jgi:hypothetical protein